MLLVLAPSKTQEAQKYPNTFDVTQPQLLDHSQQLIDTLSKMDDVELATLMKTSAKLTEQTREKIDNFRVLHSKDNSCPALFFFQGDAYSSINACDWNREQMSYAQDHLAMLSGLYGLLRPLDLMQSYRLEMGLKLAVQSTKNMYQYWGDMITQVINTMQAQHHEKVVINLASIEYSKSINLKVLVGKKIDIVFQQTKSGTTKTIPIYSKRARGAMADFVVREKLTYSEDIKNFCDDGYLFIEKESTETKWLFHTKLS